MKDQGNYSFLYRQSTSYYGDYCLMNILEDYQVIAKGDVEFQPKNSSSSKCFCSCSLNVPNLHLNYLNSEKAHDFISNS